MNSEGSIKDGGCYGFESDCRKRGTVNLKVVIEQRVDRAIQNADTLSIILSTDDTKIIKKFTILAPSFTGRGVVEYRYVGLSGNVASQWFVTDHNLSTMKTCQNTADFSDVSCNTESYA